MAGFFIWVQGQNQQHNDPYKNIHDILEQNDQLKAIFSPSVHSLIQKLRIERRNGSMTPLQFEQTVASLYNVLVAARDLKLDEIDKAKKALSQYCKFSDAVSADDREFGLVLAAFVTLITISSLILSGIGVPFVLVMLVFPAMIIGAMIGDEIGISAANDEATIFAERARCYVNHQLYAQGSRALYNDADDADDAIPHRPTTPMTVF